MENVIVVEGIKKKYEAGFFKKRVTHALTGVSLEIKKGEIFGILGPNGAGKTTLMNIIMGLLVPNEGKLNIGGINITDKFPMDLKRRMNMCSGNPNLPWSLNVVEMLKFYSMLYGMTGKKAAEKIEYLIENLELGQYKDRRYDELSTGSKQRLALAKALLNDPEILLLDEPTIGLDPDIALKTRNFIKKIHDERKITILLTTHYMKEAEMLCGRIAFIRNGNIVALGTKDELEKLTNTTGMEEMFLELANQQD